MVGARIRAYFRTWGESLKSTNIRECIRRNGVGTIAVGCLVLLAWLRPTIEIADSGISNRNIATSDTDLHVSKIDTGAVDSGPSVSQTVTVAHDVLGNAVSLLFGLMALAVVAYGVFRVVRSRWRIQGFAWLAAALGPWLALTLSGLLNGNSVSAVSVGYVALVLAIWLCAPQPSVLRVVGVLGAISAGASIVLAVVRPGIGIMASGKAAFGGLLAGPYLHPNILGIILALSLPFVFLIRHRVLRWASVALVLTALVWSGARTSQLAAGMVVIGYLVSRLFPRPRWLLIGLPATAFGLVAMLPMITSEPAAFTYRGRMWLAAMDRWAAEPLLGGGPQVLSEPRIVQATGAAFSHAHNGAVQLLVTSGVVGLALFVLLAAMAWRNATKMVANGFVTPLFFLISYGFVSVFEASHLLMTVFGFFTWAPLLIISRFRTEDVEFEKLAAEPSGPERQAELQRAEP